ncbi:hypothetical protein [Candidatus Solincola sp.]|jgi:sarcosine oxidase delta subunit|nr:hypothetical protein [Actinomycetota bacterium]MDI7251785.1 hypothetical protein [Actinomycetota bacterium]
MVTCSRCGRSGSLAEFAYVGQAVEVGPVSLRRCPACGELLVVDELELERDGSSSPGPWGLSDIWGRKFTCKNGEV